jgi:hypothetical protein
MSRWTVAPMRGAFGFVKQTVVGALADDHKVSLRDITNTSVSALNRFFEY